MESARQERYRRAVLNKVIMTADLVHLVGRYYIDRLRCLPQLNGRKINLIAGGVELICGLWDVVWCLAAKMKMRYASGELR